MIQTLKENPPPGSYDVANSFRKSQDKRTVSMPRSKNGLRRAFLSTSDRFALPRDIITDAPETDVPGPGELAAILFALALIVRSSAQKEFGKHRCCSQVPMRKMD